jgi:mannan endo-1,4-beta-mannosidase
MVGANNYYFAFSGANGQARLLDLVCQAGLNVLRIWAFNDFKPVRGGAIPADTDICFQFMRPGRDRPELRDGPVGLERLDRAVKLAGERGIGLILTLTNYWPDYGGMPQYREWLGLPDVNDFYRDARAKSTFQNWVHALITRQNPLTGLSFSEDPTILAWEIANEPRSTGKTGSTDLLTEWLREMSEFVRVYAPNQLIAAGDEGFFANRTAGRGWLYDGSTGVDTERILALPEIDIGTFHLYPDVYAPKHNPETFGRGWVQAHLDCGMQASKPVVLAEYGLPDCPERNQIYRAWLDEIEGADGGGDLVWMIGLAGMGDRYLLTSHRDAPAIGEHAASFVEPQISR